MTRITPLVLATVVTLLAGCGQLGFPATDALIAADMAQTSLVAADVDAMVDPDRSFTVSFTEVDGLDYDQFLVAFELLGMPDGETLEDQVGVIDDERLMFRAVGHPEGPLTWLSWQQGGLERGVLFEEGTREIFRIVE